GNRHDYGKQSAPSQTHCRAPGGGARPDFSGAVYATEGAPSKLLKFKKGTTVNQAKKLGVLIAIILTIAAGYYFLSVNSSKTLELIGTVDANQVIVSAKITGRIEKLYVDEGSEVKQGDLIAQLDTAELQAQTQSAAAAESSMRHKVQESHANEQLAKGTTSNDVRNAEANLQATKAALAQAQADMMHIQADAKRTDALADAGVASQQERDLADSNLNSEAARIRTLEGQVKAAQASLESTR